MEYFTVVFEENKEIKIIKEAALQGKKISLVLYILKNSSEIRLQRIVKILLDLYNRRDLLEILYTSIKEMTINATKANLKRVIFEENNIDIHSEKPDECVMDEFRSQLRDKKIEQYEQKFKKRGLPITISFSHNSNRILIKVKNQFVLCPEEEKRIRDKAAQSLKVEDLIQYYMEQSDNTEGAGMGISLITILLRQSGIDPHCFTIYATDTNETIAKLELPLKPNYISNREQNELLLSQRKKTTEKLRKISST